MKQLDGLFHGHDGGGHKRREADEFDIALLDGLEYLLRIDVAAQVKDGVSVVVEQHLNDVFANIVDVALDGGHADLALVAISPAGIRRLMVSKPTRAASAEAISCGKKNLPWSKRTPTSSRAGIK